ncbi:hypothetical protein GCM10019059_37810 [Camelimonas fluminis]|uniref:Uncharacterized protein n=1 Tax=Camelimonas fluminis TaxID=1576911 RepID=A0ABV7UQC4_9HYPH|nr:hypothetical protein [Camelimonas fluminis]GHE74714.1 hypothetical protein GCM10019059_37810 [Camelimonas fluminis]
MVAVPFPKQSTPGARPGEGEGRRVNAWIDKDGDKDVVRRSPGLVQVLQTDKTGIRGALNVGGAWVLVYTGSVVRITGSTVTTLTGSIPGDDGVTIARNNKATGGVSTPDVVAVRSSGGAYVITTTAVSSYPDADLPATVNSVEFLGGYFHFTIPDGRLFASELNSTDVNALSVTTAESRPDGLRRAIATGSLLYAMGESTIEPYQNVGTQPYPMQRATTVIPVGVLATMAACGNEEAWNNPLFFVASDYTVRSLSGYETARISTPDVERFVQASDRAQIRMVAHVWRGVGFVILSSDKGSWEFDTTRGAWAERESVGSDRWRGGPTWFDNDRWLVADRLTGDVLTFSGTNFTENGSPLPVLLESGPTKDFPARIAVPSLFLDFTMSSADVHLSWSHNGGQTWAAGVDRSLATADRWPVRVNRLGLSTHHGIRIRITTDTDQDLSFIGANIPIPDKRPVA